MNKEDLKAIAELLNTKLEPIKSRLDEHTQILRALEYSAEVSKAESDNLCKTEYMG